jgi:PBP1b-binding outer membrane lipoprotein LpoB
VRKIIMMLVLIVVFLLGCSNTEGGSSNVLKDSKVLYGILYDYMKNGVEITESQQRKIDSYLSSAEKNMENYSEEEQILVNHILTMNSDIFYYNAYEKDSDKKKAMDDFYSEAQIVEQILD